MSVPKIMISSIDFIIMEKRIYKSNGRSIRRITEIAEVAGVEEGTIQLNKLFQWDSETDSFENLTIVSKTLAEIANLRGVSINALNKEWEKRKLVLDFLVENNISKQDNLSKILEEYYLNPKVLLSKINH
jgi:flagellar protein FlaI